MRCLQEMTSKNLVDRIPRKLTCPLKRDHLKRRFHLPTINFQRICYFSGGRLAFIFFCLVTSFLSTYFFRCGQICKKQESCIKCIIRNKTNVFSVYIDMIICIYIYIYRYDHATEYMYVYIYRSRSSLVTGVFGLRLCPSYQPLKLS